MDGERIPDFQPAFLARLEGQLGSELPSFLSAMDGPPVRGLRLNRLKQPAMSFEADFAGSIPWERDGFFLKNESILGSTLWHQAGCFYLQEPAAMVPPAILDARPGEKILDLCAAPGGKSVALGLRMAGDGILVCNEPAVDRAKVLSGNLERMGIPNAVVISAYPENLTARWAESFDGVLVDAPCSGEGMFRRLPASRGEWSGEKAAGCAQRQRRILACAAELVRPGGRLVYATCTWNPEENEENVAWFLSRFPAFRPEAFFLPGIDAPEGFFTCWPHRLPGEGQFACLLRKGGDGMGRNAGNAGSGVKKTPEAGLPPVSAQEARSLREAFPGFPPATHCFGKTLVHLPLCPDLQGLKVLRAGLHLAERRGKTWVPDHALALSFRPPVCEETEVSEEGALRYFSGEALPGGGKGWMLLKVQGLAVGWVKGTEGRLQNHYPKGLRTSGLRAWPAD